MRFIHKNENLQMMNEKRIAILIIMVFGIMVPLIMTLFSTTSNQSGTTSSLITTTDSTLSTTFSNQTRSDVSNVTTTVVFLLRHGGYHFSTITTVGNKIEVVFNVYDWMPAPMVIVYRTFTITYPSTMTPIIFGVAYHYDKNGKIVRTKILPPGGVLEK